MSASGSAAFISYSREDSDFALRLAQDLKSAGASIWLDQMDIAPGHPWDNAIEDALRDAPQVLVVLTPTSVRSENVRNEISFALRKGKIIVPVLYQDCDVPLRLERTQHIDFRSDYARGLKFLLAYLDVSNPNPATLEQAEQGDAQRRAAWQAREAEAQRLKDLELAQQQELERKTREAEALRLREIEQRKAAALREAEAARRDAEAAAQREAEQAAAEAVRRQQEEEAAERRIQETRARQEAQRKAEQALQRPGPPEDQQQQVPPTEIAPEATFQPRPSLVLLDVAAVVAGLAWAAARFEVTLAVRNFHIALTAVGLLVIVQFAGAVLGAVTSSRNLRRSLLQGLGAAVALALFPLIPSLAIGCVLLAVGGFGYGRLLVCLNMIAARRDPSAPTRNLLWLNASWAAGALLFVITGQIFEHSEIPPILPLLIVALPLIVLFVLFMRQSESGYEQAANAGSTPGARVIPMILLLLLGALTGVASMLNPALMGIYAERSILAFHVSLGLAIGFILGRIISALLARRFAGALLERTSLLIVTLCMLARFFDFHVYDAVLVPFLTGLALAPLFPALIARLLSLDASVRAVALGIAAFLAGTFLATPLSVMTHTWGFRVGFGASVLIALLAFAITFFRSTPRTT